MFGRGGKMRTRIDGPRPVFDEKGEGSVKAYAVMSKGVGSGGETVIFVNRTSADCGLCQNGLIEKVRHPRLEIEGRDGTEKDRA